MGFQRDVTILESFFLNVKLLEMRWRIRVVNIASFFLPTRAPTGALAGRTLGPGRWAFSLGNERGADSGGCVIDGESGSTPMDAGGRSEE